MRTIEEPRAMQAWALEQRRAGRSIGFVPTMGALHDGHLSLVRRCRAENDWCVASIFVNPTQFGAGEDFDKYPRDLAHDAELLEAEGIDVLFAPTAEAMYPAGFSTSVEETALSKPLCGASRPGHFRGVATVVLKLFNLVQPTRAYFGQKDAQQARVIQQMVRDLAAPVEVVILPTVREADGLAMSSRNAYLKPDERREAVVLYEALEWARKAVDTGERSADTLARGIRQRIAAKSTARVDYVSVVDFETLQEVQRLSGTVLVALAVFFGTTRLIDNVLVQVEPTEE
jgi:pantoate--beta-alanine ligase